MKTRIILFVNLIIFCGLVISNAQINIPLKIDQSEKSSVGNILFCDKDYNCGLTKNEKQKINDPASIIPLIKVSRDGENFSLLVDTDLNGKITDEKSIGLKKESSVVIKIKRKLTNGKVIFLPFEILHEQVENENITADYFKIIPNYVSAGKLTYKNCSANIAISDMDFDGEFNLKDAERGTNFRIDNNNDGKFWGKGEFYKTSEIIEFCGQNFLVSALKSSQIILTPTDLKLAKIGENVPTFSFELIDGEKISSANLYGKLYILDFWASWCIPCVKNLPEIVTLKKEFENEVKIYSINVDKFSQKAIANKIINQYGLSDFSSIRGLGENDMLWKTFGGANSNYLSIPLYVLIDQNGVVRYADKGGENLFELKESINKIVKR